MFAMRCYIIYTWTQVVTSVFLDESNRQHIKWLHSSLCNMLHHTKHSISLMLTNINSLQTYYSNQPNLFSLLYKDDMKILCRIATNTSLIMLKEFLTITKLVTIFQVHILWKILNTVSKDIMLTLHVGKGLQRGTEYLHTNDKNIQHEVSQVGEVAAVGKDSLRWLCNISNSTGENEAAIFSLTSWSVL